MVVKVFDGSRRALIREIYLLIQIGPHTIEINLQVMDITPIYNLLLGRTWIHVSVVMTSTLNQKLKFVVENKMIFHLGKVDMLESHLSYL